VRSILLFALIALILPSALLAESSAPKFTGPPENFAGLLSTQKVLLTLKLSTGGAFTGILDFATGAHNVLRGTVNSTGFFSGTTGVNRVPYTLQITGSSPGTYLLTGSAEGKLIFAYSATYSSRQIPAELGAYNVLLASADNGPSTPGGIGYATLTVSKGGSAKITGNLGDGTKFSAGGFIVSGTSNHQFVVYDRGIYKNPTGLFSGILTFGAVPSPAQLNPLILAGGTTTIVLGDLLWHKPAGPGDYYPLGFTTGASAQGLPFVKAAGIPFTTGTLAITGGILGSTGTTQAFTVNTAGDVVVSLPNPGDIKLTINKNTGAVSGSFKQEVPTTPLPKLETIKFSGLLLQDGTDSEAGGYFKSPVVSGTGLYGNIILP
jgi:hypothetical protein